MIERIEMRKLIFILTFICSKVVVIDDLGVTKRFPLDKKPLIDKVRNKIKSGDEEVVIYGKNPANRNIKISSKDIDRSELFKKTNELKKQIQKENNKRIIDSLKKLVGVDQNPILTQMRNKKALENNPKEKIRVINMKQLDNIDIDEPVIEKQGVNTYKESPGNSIEDFPLSSDYPKFLNDPLPNNRFFNLSNKNNYNENTAPHYHTDMPDIRYLNKPYNNTNPENLNLYNPNPPLYDPNKGSLPTLYPEYPDTSNPLLKDNISLLKAQEKENLTRAIQNRKEYLRIKTDEVHGNKEKVAQQLEDYKSRVEDIVNRIKYSKKVKDNMISKINMQQNHIDNLRQNSKIIKEKENKLRSLIKHTKNEILKYKSLLENETSKMEVLEKQYDVYENTLKKYDNESDQEGFNLSKYSNDLSKYENDLKDLNDMFSIYSGKLNELNDDLNKQTKLEAGLAMEANKLNRTQLSTFV